MALTKRAYDNRVFEVSLAPAIRDDETISAVTSVAMVEDGSDVTISDVDSDASVVAFLASGGDAGAYQVRIQFTIAGTPAQRAEVIVPLRVH